jgi:hypothetical protein
MLSRPDLEVGSLFLNRKQPQETYEKRFTRGFWTFILCVQGCCTGVTQVSSYANKFAMSMLS